jgi:polysaccharide export outer membrane protein
MRILFAIAVFLAALVSILAWKVSDDRVATGGSLAESRFAEAGSGETWWSELKQTLKILPFEERRSGGQDGDGAGRRVLAEIADLSPTRRSIAKASGGDCAPGEPASAASVVAGDKLRLRFFEQPADGAKGMDRGLDLSALVFERLDLSGTYEVDDAGEVSIPLLARVPVRGQSLACVERQVANRYREALGTPASVTAGFETRHPVLVSGAVRSPGAYATLPDMTVRHALALAGAEAAGAAASAQTLTNLAARRAELDRLVLSLELEIRRIEAVMAGKTEIGIDRERLRTMTSVLGQRRVDSELAALRAAVDARGLARANASSHLEELSSRVELLKNQQAVTEAQIKQKRRRLDELQALNAQGLAPLYRLHAEELSQMNLERAQFQVSLDLATAEDALDAARRDLPAQASADRSTLAGELRDRVTELNAIEGQLSAVAMQIDALTKRPTADAEVPLELVVVRKSAEGLIDIDASLDTTLLPGDILEVGARARTRDQLADASIDSRGGR